LFLRAAGACLAAAAGKACLPGRLANAGDTIGKEDLLTRVARPQNLETPVKYFTSWLTPTSRFFVRSHFGPPNPDSLAQWRLHVEGDVRERLSLSLSDLRTFGEVSLPAVLQCAGNGRAYFAPKVPGAQWRKGAVGNATWTGVRLAEVLKRAGLGPKAKHVQMLGADRPVLPTVPLFLRSIPIEKAMHPATLLAYRMNGEPLAVLHGGPLRLVVPGWAGESWTKWVTNLRLQDLEAEGFYMATAYRMPVSPVAPGTTVSPSEMAPVQNIVVKSIIARPSEEQIPAAGDLAIEGVAFTGEGEVVRVEISTNGGQDWRDAELIGEHAPYAWRLWRYLWKGPPPGAYTLLSRATDSRGQTQPMTAAWNPSGYLWNAVDRVRVQVIG
jgi:DMSO/TMAO reductase YedYZ molybdopterin-dependent catalytic subunit